MHSGHLSKQENLAAGDLLPHTAASYPAAGEFDHDGPRLLMSGVGWAFLKKSYCVVKPPEYCW